MADYNSEEFKKEALQKQIELYSSKKRCDLCKYCEYIYKEKTKGIFNKRQEKILYGYYCHVTGEFSRFRDFSDCEDSYKLDLDKLKDI